MNLKVDLGTIANCAYRWADITNLCKLVCFNFLNIDFKPIEAILVRFV